MRSKLNNFAEHPISAAELNILIKHHMNIFVSVRIVQRFFRKNDIVF